MADARSGLFLYHGFIQQNKNSLKMLLKNCAYKREPGILTVDAVILFYLLFFHKYEDCCARYFLRTIVEYCP